MLAVKDIVIARNGRISVSNHAGTTFNLHINNIKEDDRGEYMCQINTTPMKSQSGFLRVFGKFFYNFIWFALNNIELK